MKNGTKFLIGLCAVFSLIAKAQFFPIPADVVPYGDNQRSLKGSSVDFRFSDSTKQLLVGLTASASRPAYSFPGTGNNDNGLWRSGTDEISLVTAGVNRLTIGPTGAISFGTSVTPFVVRTGDTMTGGLTVLSGVTAQVFQGPLIGGVTGDVVGNVTGSSSLNVLKAGDTMSGALRTTATGSSATHNSNSIAADGGISAAADIFAGRNGARGALRLKCDTGSECWRLSVGGAGGDVALEVRSVLGGDVPITVQTAGQVTFSNTIQATGGTMTGLLGVGTLAYIGSTSGEIKFRAPATAGSQSYQWPSAQPSTSNSYLVGITTGAMVWEPIPQSEIFLQGTTSYGSTATKARRWITTVTNTGSAVTLTQSATNGDTLTINETGAYGISYCDNFNAASNMGISINASGTTSVQSLPPSQVACGNVSASVDIGACCSAIIAVSSGSVVRAHTDGTLNGSNLWMQSIRIRKIGP